MDIATILGIFISFCVMTLSISAQGSSWDFVNLPSFLLVFGGTMGATITQYPLSLIRHVGLAILKTIVSNTPQYEHTITLFTDLALRARREGILSLEILIKNITDPFLHKGLQLTVDGLDPTSIREIMEAEMNNTHARHEYGATMLEAMASYAPALGMMGTVIGLVQMLNTMQDPSTIGPKMALALITTFYGVVLANLVFLPLAGKLRLRSQQELFVKEMELEGIIGIANGENPRILREKLTSFQSPRDRKENRKWLEDA